MKEKKWIYKTDINDRNKIFEFAGENSIPPVIATLLFNRGIKTTEKMCAFFSRSAKDIHNPLSLNDCEKAAERIIAAIKNKEKIAVYGDYDVDGITSTALLYDFLKQMEADVSYYIPNRVSEGYGMNIVAVNKLIKNGVKLLITVDCGITAVGEVEFSNLQKTDVIITDHHTCKEKLPRASAVINPKRHDNEYPFEMLAGVGVAFKLMLCVVMKMNLNTTEYLDKYSDLTAIGTVSDLVSITGENRSIVYRGMQNIKKCPRVGIAALLDKAGIDYKSLKSTDIAFGIAPRLNAAGRMGSAELGLKLLLSNNIEEASKYAELLNSENEKRRGIECEIYNEALSQINSDINFSAKKVIVVSGKEWHEGVIGIVASRLTEHFYRPAIVLSENKGVCKGSGRSIPGFDLFEALSSCKDVLSDFGGHSSAAGLSLGAADIDKFIADINKYANTVLKESDMIPRIQIDCELSASSPSIELVKAMSVFEPYGEDNEVPVFSMKHAAVSYISRIGHDKSHLRMTVVKNAKQFNCVGFKMGDFADYINTGDNIDIAFNIDINKYKGNEYLQFLLKDIKLG